MFVFNKFANAVKLFLLVGVLQYLPFTVEASDGYFLASNESIRFSGRVAFYDDQAYMTWPGTSVHFSIQGSRFLLDMEDDSGNNYYNVIFNGQDEFPYVLNTKQGRHTYDLSHMISSEITEVTIFKRTEGAEGGTLLHGVILENEQSLRPGLPAPQRRILFYGDSITVGMGNEAAHNTQDDLASEKNHYLSYAPVTARNLNAEFHSIAKSGIGFMVSWFDFIMPEYYDQLTAQSNNDTVWDFSQWQPDVVVVNLGQNDKWLIENQGKLSATPEEIKQAYEHFIRTLMELHPKALFVCAIGSMDASSNERWPNYIASAVANIKATPNNINDAQRITTTVFDFTGYGAHPRLWQHQQNAEKLTSLIKQELNW